MLVLRGYSVQFVLGSAEAEVEMNRTAPSPKRKLQPPVCRLLKARRWSLPVVQAVPGLGLGESPLPTRPSKLHELLLCRMSKDPAVFVMTSRSPTRKVLLEPSGIVWME